MTVKKGIIVASLLVMLIPGTAFAGVSGSVDKGYGSATVTVGADGGPQTTHSPSSSNSSGGNGNRGGGGGGGGGGQSSPSSWYQDLIETAKIVSQGYLKNGERNGVITYNGTAFQEAWAGWSASTGGETIRQVIPLYWDWKFVNKDTGKTEYAMSGPLQRITRTFYDPGHYYVYYREYDKWETGRYITVSGYVTVMVDGLVTQEPYSYTIWQSTGWHEGYLYGEDFKYLLDFELSTEQVGGGRGKTITVERGGKDVTQQQVETYTVQTVAR